MGRENRVTIREVLSRRFFLNCVISLLATIWFPLAQMTVLDGEGNVISSSYLPMYRIYWTVIQSPGSWSAWWYIFVHVTIIFSMSFFVWYLFLKASKGKAASEDEQETGDT